ncbi:histidine kinase [Sinosporangium siamense]|nr:histidine kinase [Sinosporangium siamense]
MSVTGYALLAFLSPLSALIGFLLARSGRFRSWRSTAALDALRGTARTAAALRAGLTQAAARRAVRHLRPLLGATAVALSSADPSAPDAVLAFDAVAGHTGAHLGTLPAHVRSALGSGGPHVAVDPGCAPGCPIRGAVVVPLTTSGRAAGALAVYGSELSASSVRAVTEVADWVSGQLELAELDASRRRAHAAETRALRAQISPHFIGNSLTTIASFVRTDPERARDLVMDFADVARHALRRCADFTPLADELRCLDRYVALECARFGERLVFSVRAEPELLPVPVPFLCLQPLVENAIRHGVGSRPGRGTVCVVVRDAGRELHISVEDDGVGMEPGYVRGVLAAAPGTRLGGGGVGLANVDVRLRRIYGDEHGLTVETAPGEGTTVRLRVPKDVPPDFTVG